MIQNETFLHTETIPQTYAYTPADLEGVLTYCDNPVNTPNSNGANYNFIWDNSLVKLNEYMSYPCRPGYRVEQNTDWRHEADSATAVLCGEDGQYSYPSTWPQCSNTVTCSDPGNSLEVTRTYLSGNSLQYMSELKWVCDDKRKYIKLSMETNSALVPYKTAKCHWRKTYPLDGSDLLCVIHHCRHPHDEPGRHDPPSPDLQLDLECGPDLDQDLYFDFDLDLNIDF